MPCFKNAIKKFSRSNFNLPKVRSDLRIGFAESNTMDIMEKRVFQTVENVMLLISQFNRVSPNIYFSDNVLNHSR